MLLITLWKRLRVMSENEPGVFLPEKYNLVKNCLWDTGSILDVGCGQGGLVHQLRLDGHKAKGIDKKAYPNMVKGKAEDLSKHFNNGEFRVVCLFDILEHVNNDLKVLKEAKTVCEAGGQIIISVPNSEPDGWSEYFGFVNAPHKDKTHKRHYSKKQLTRLCLNAGFSKEDTRIFESGYLNPIGLALDCFWVPWWLASKIGTFFNLFMPVKKYKGTLYAVLEKW